MINVLADNNIIDKLEDKFESNAERFSKDPNDREAAIVIYNIAQYWINFFFYDHQENIWDIKLDKRAKGESKKNEILKFKFDKRDKDDLKQEIISKFFEILKRIKFEHRQQAKKYLLKIFQSKCIDFLRKKNKNFLVFEENLNKEIYDMFIFEDSSEFSIKDKYMLIKSYWKKALSISKETTPIIIRCLGMKMSYEKINEELGKKYSQDGFSTIVRRAKEDLQKNLLKVLKEAVKREKMSAMDFEVINDIINNIIGDIEERKKKKKEKK